MGDALWSPSYFAGSCGGAPIEIIRQYIEQRIHRTKYHLYVSMIGVALYPPPKVGGFTGNGG